MKNTIFISFSLAESSVSDYFLLLVHRLNREYQVVIFSDVKKSESIALSNDVIVKYWPSVRPTKLADGIFLCQNIKKYKPILTVSIFGSVNIFLIVGFFCGVNKRVAWIRTLSSQFPQKKLLILRKSLVYKLSTNLISNSLATKDDVVEKFGVPESKIKVLPNSVSDAYERIILEKSKHNTITYVGRLHHSKGVDILIRAFSLIHTQFPDFKLVLVGNGEQKNNIVNLVKELRLENHVEFKGNLSKNKVLEVFKNTYLAVIPSRSEAFGYTVIEAMSMKTLVVGADNTGIAEIIKDLKTGMLFRTGSSIDLAQRIIKAIDEPLLRDKLAIEGYKHFIHNYELKKAIERDYSYFKSLINTNE